MPSSSSSGAKGVAVLQAVGFVLLLNFSQPTQRASQKVALSVSSQMALLQAPFLALVYFQALGESNLCPTTYAALELVYCCRC